MDSFCRVRGRVAFALRTRLEYTAALVSALLLGALRSRASGTHWSLLAYAVHD